MIINNFFLGSVFILKTSLSIIKYRYIKSYNIKYNINKFKIKFTLFKKYLNSIKDKLILLDKNFINIIYIINKKFIINKIILNIKNKYNIFHSIYIVFNIYLKKLFHDNYYFIFIILYKYINKNILIVDNKNNNTILIITELYYFNDLYKINLLNIKLIIIKKFYFYNKIYNINNINILYINNISKKLKNYDFLLIDLINKKFYINIKSKIINKIINKIN